MARSFSFFKELEDLDNIDEIGFVANPFEASYLIDDSEFDLSIEYEGGSPFVFRVVDSDHNWDITKHGLNLKRIISFKDLSLLFGESGVVSKNSVLGIAVVCTSVVSDRKEVFKLCTFTSDVKKLDVDCSIFLSNGKYRGNVTVKTLLYLSSCGDEISGFPKQSGTILGTFDSFDIILLEKRTLFPVYEVESRDGVPWWVECNWSNISEDPFTQEYVSVVINRSSKQYSNLSLDSGPDSNPLMLAEVMCSAIQIIIAKAMESTDEWNRLMSGAIYPEGTIAFMLQYMHSTFEWDYSSPERLAKSIHEYVYSRMVLE